jgi:hypothetical protein
MTANPLRAARGTTATLNTRVLKDGELAYNTDTEELHVGDGSTLGGRPISSEVDGDDIDVTATGGTTAIDLATRFGRMLTPEDFGAVGDGTTNDSTALQAWLNCGDKYLQARGNYGVGTMLTIAKGVHVDAAGATFRPTANVNVFRLHGGAILKGYPDIITTGFSGWDKQCVRFDGASETGGDTTNFRMPDKTICEVRCEGKTDSDGTNGGDAIAFITTDDGVNNQWIMGVWVWAKIKGFDRAIYMLKDGTDVARTFVNQNHIFADVGGNRQSLVMESDHATNYAIDGNWIDIDAQTRDNAANHTAIANIICGQKNRIHIEQIDWVGGNTGTLKAVQIEAGTRDLVFETRRLETQYLENLSSERSVVIDNGIDGSGPTYGTFPTVIRAGAPASRTATGENGDIAFDDDWLYVYEGANDWKQFPTANWRVLSRNFAAASHTGNTNETTLRTVSVPANALGPNGVLRVTAYWSHTNSANVKTLRTKLGGTTLFSPAPTTTGVSIHQYDIANRNATNSQITKPNALAATSGFGAAGGPFTTATVDTTSAQDIVFTAQLANSGETITLEGYLIEISYGA